MLPRYQQLKRHSHWQVLKLPHCDPWWVIALCGSFFSALFQIAHAGVFRLGAFVAAPFLKRRCENGRQEKMPEQPIDFGTIYYQVTDTTDDGAKAKLTSAVVKHMSAQGMAPNFMLFPARNSIAVGVEVSELVTNSERPARLIVGANYAPPDKKEGTKNNVRNDFFCAKLKGDAFVCGTSNGFEFSYIKPEIEEFYRLTNTNHLHSQFRSLEVLPKHAILFSVPTQRARLLAEGHLERIKNIDSIVPPPPDMTHVLEVDNFGNVKLVPSPTDRVLIDRLAKERSPLYVSFGKASLEVGGRNVAHSKPYEIVAAEAFFDCPEGTNILAARSSSRLVGGEAVPMLATLRACPAETQPDYQKDLPVVGAPVKLWPKIRVLGSPHCG